MADLAGVGVMATISGGAIRGGIVLAIAACRGKGNISRGGAWIEEVLPDGGLGVDAGGVGKRSGATEGAAGVGAGDPCGNGDGDRVKFVPGVGVALASFGALSSGVCDFCHASPIINPDTTVTATAPVPNSHVHFEAAADDDAAAEPGFTSSK